MVVSDKNKYDGTLNTFKRACYDLGRKVFKVDRPVEISVKEEDEKDMKKYFNMKVAPVAYYKDGKIHFPSFLLDLIIDDYRNPKVAENILGTLIHEYMHHLLGLEEISEDESRPVNEGIAEAMKILYSKLVGRCLDENGKSLDDILACSNEKFLNILGSQSEISRIEKEIEMEYRRTLRELKESIRDSLSYCSRRSSSKKGLNQILDYIKALDRMLEIVYNVLYRTAGYALLKRKGIKKLVEDVSKISKREEADKLLKEYEKILFEELENLESRGYKISEAIDCLERKKMELLDKVFDFNSFVNALTSSVERKIKEQDERIKRFEEEQKNLKSK